MRWADNSSPADGWLLDMRSMNRVIDFDRQRGVIHAQAGITWPDLIRHYVVAQRDGGYAWGIRQKQTGADRLTIGGAVSANIHGRGLAYAPFVSDIEALEVILADGSVVQCDRQVNPDLFRHVIGGYGLFGVVTSVKIRLVPRQKVERVVELCDIEEVAEGFEQRIEAGYLYGDFQFATAPEDPGFLSRGVFSCYRAVDPRTVIPDGQIRLSPADWRRLLYLAHRNKSRAFHEFTDFYLRSSGQIYWSDTHQLSVYLDDYHGRLDRAFEASVPGSEMITELYVPRARLAAFMSDVRKDFRRHEVDLVYGTVRLIQRDSETALAWARANYACVIFNLHVDHEPYSIGRFDTSLPSAHRHRDPSSRQLLPDVSPLRQCCTSARVLSAVRGIPAQRSGASTLTRCFAAIGIGTTGASKSGTRIPTSPASRPSASSRRRRR